MPNRLSVALSALGSFFSGVPRVRKLTLGYKYFTATRFRDGVASEVALHVANPICVNLRPSAVDLFLPFALFAPFRGYSLFLRVLY
jgi:hypothetical protein